MPPASRVGKKSTRVLESLRRSLRKEVDPWRYDDLYVAWHCVRFAAAGREDAWEAAWFHYYGKSLEKSLAYWRERDRITAQALERCRLMVEEQERLDSLPPKKPSQFTLNFSVDESEEEA